MKLPKKIFHLKFFVFLTVFLGLTSCVKKVDIKAIDEYDPKPVMAGFISNNEGSEVFLSRSMKVYSPVSQNNTMDSASVYIKDGQTVLSLLQWDDGRYVSSFNGQPGEVYTVEAEFENGETVKARVDMPEIPLLSAEQMRLVPFRTQEDVDELSDTVLIKVHFRLQDPPGQHNYYQIIATGPYGESVCPALSIDYHHLEPGPADRSGFYYQGTYFFSDKDIDGQEVYFNVYFDHRYVSSSSDYMYFQIRQLNEDLYRYYSSLVRSGQLSGVVLSGTSSFSGENIYSNVEGGLGTVGAYSQRKDSLEWVN